MSAAREHFLAMAAAHEAQAKAYDAYRAAEAVEPYQSPGERAAHVERLARLAEDYRDMARSCADYAAKMEATP